MSISDETIKKLTGCERGAIPTRVQRSGSMGRILASSANEYLCVADMRYQVEGPTHNPQDYEIVEVPQSMTYWVCYFLRKIWRPAPPPEVVIRPAEAQDD